MKVFDFNAKIFASSEDEVAKFTEAFMDFIREHRAEGRAVTAVKLTEALENWKNNAFVKNHINNHFKIQ